MNLTCEQHDFLKSGCSPKMEVVSKPATASPPPQSRDIHSAARRDCVVHLLLSALEPQPSFLDCHGDEILAQSGFLRRLICWNRLCCGQLRSKTGYFRFQLGHSCRCWKWWRCHLGCCLGLQPGETCSSLLQQNVLGISFGFQLQQPFLGPFDEPSAIRNLLRQRLLLCCNSCSV